MELRKPFQAVALCWALAANAAAAPEAAPEAVRAAFKDALAHPAAPSASAGGLESSSMTPAAAAASDPAELKAYVLYPYLEAARLRDALSKLKAPARDAATEAGIRKFLDAQARAPVTYDLRRDWLLYLGQRQAWKELLEFAPASPDDPAVQCYALSARLATGERSEGAGGLRDAIVAQWLAPRPAAPACDELFAWLDVRERVSDAEIEARARLVISTREPLPATFIDLPPARRAVLTYWNELLANPERGLKKFIADGPPKDVEEQLPDAPNEALLDAFARVARRSSRAATPLFAKLIERKAFSDEDRANLRLAYALGLATDHEAEAVRQFAHVPEPALDGNAREWRMRAALYQQDWPRVIDWYEAMPPSQQAEPRWRYFKARALERLGRKDEAHALYAEVAKEREYYAFLAAERLGRRPEVRPQALPDEPKVRARIAAMPPMQRAQELLDCELPELAMAEFRYGLRDVAAGAKPQAARLAAEWGWHEAVIQLLSDLQKWDDLWLRFPRPFDREVDAAAKDTGLPADWIYAVLRTESLYNPRAVSSADALGLLQIRLRTARQVAGHDGLAKPERDDLLRPGVNIQLGARYLRELHDRFGGRLIYTLAAYNAGPQRLPEWVPKKDMPADLWVENVPYFETRTYVQRVLSSVALFGWRRTGTPTALAPLLTEATPLREGVGPWKDGTRNPVHR